MSIEPPKESHVAFDTSIGIRSRFSTCALSNGSSKGATTQARARSQLRYEGGFFFLGSRRSTKIPANIPRTTDMMTAIGRDIVAVVTVIDCNELG